MPFTFRAVTNTAFRITLLEVFFSRNAGLCKVPQGEGQREQRPEAEKAQFLSSWERAPCRTPQASCKRCSSTGWSFGRFVLWIRLLWPSGRCGWCLWEQGLFYWEHRQNANVEKLAGRVCWGQSQEITSAPELRAVGQASEIVPEGQAAPAALHCFMR